MDLVSCIGTDGEVLLGDPDLTLPHPYAHVRAFVLIPWLAVDPDATVTVEGRARPVAACLDAVDAGESAGVRRTDLQLRLTGRG